MKKDYITIPFQDENGQVVLELKFYITDENIHSLDAKYHSALETYAKERAKGEEATWQELRQQIKDTFMIFVSEEEYMQLESFTDSSLILMHYLTRIVDGIFKELAEIQDTSILNKYVLREQLGNAETSLTLE